MTIQAERTAGTPAQAPGDAPAGVALARALAREFRPHVLERERRGDPPYEELARIRETGLVNLHIPVAYGGGGGTWRQLARVVVELSRADPNIGGLLAYHYHNFIAPFWDPYFDAADIQRKSAANRWLWGHITGPVGAFKAVPQPDGGFVVSGTKPQNTGPATGDVTVLLAQRADRREAVYAYVPTDRKGIVYHGGWDHLGLRRTATQPITFDGVVVHPDEVLPNTTGRPIKSMPRFYYATGSLAFGAIYVGAAWGALETARALLRSQQETTGTAADPRVLAVLGELVGKATALLDLQDEAARRLDQAYARRRTLTDDEHDAVGMHAEAFRGLAARGGIEIGNRVYDALGPAAADRAAGLDRYWRDVRIHSLHPPSYPQSDILLGDWAVNGQPVRLVLPL